MKKKRNRLLACMLLCIITSSIYGQAKTAISGIVKDTLGNGIAGVSVSAKGSKVLAISSEKGEFSLTLPSLQTVLVFSSIGFENREVLVSDNSFLTVVLQASAGQGNDVVVTALGVKKDRRSVGYAISSVKGEELTKSGVTLNPFLALYGKAAGVGVNIGASGPMGGLKLNIRGNVSLNSSSNLRPLFVIDGAIISDRPTSMGGGVGAGYDYGSNINDINSEDIESIDILKGAKATVLYGTDAANGVVLITTKSGRNVKGFGMSGAFQYTIEKPRSYLELQDQYGLGDNIYDTSYATINGQQVRQVPNRRYSFGPKFDGADMMFYDSSMVTNTPHNSYNDLFRTGHSYTANVAIAGSSEKGSLRASYTNYRYNDITSANTWQQRNTFSFNGNIRASKLASFELITNIYNIVSQNRREGNGGSIAWGFPVDYDYNSMYKNLYLDETGYQRDLSLMGVPAAINNIGNYMWAYDKNRQRDDKFHIVTTAKTTLNFSKHVFFTGQFGLDYDNTNYKSEISVTRIIPTVANGGFSYMKENNTIQTYQGLLNYSNDFMNDNLHLSGFGGFIYRLRTSESLGSSTIGGLNFPGWYSFQNQAGTPDAGNAYLLRNFSRGSDVLYSGVASATLAWRNEFYLELQARQDWNSTLPPENNKYFYPGASLTWNYTDRFSIPHMNKGQVRFSWADVGNGTNRYFANNLYSVGYLNGTGVRATTISPPGQLLPGALRPERKREFEIGINNSFFKQNRLTFDISYYTANRYDQIIGLPIPQTSSSSSLLINVGNLKTWGIEFQVTGTPIVTKNLRWDITLNGARQGSRVKELYQDIVDYTFANLINSNAAASIRADLGRPFGEIKMYDYTRDDQGNRVVNGSGVYSLNSNTADMVIAGNIMPKVYGGLLSDLRYKNFNLRIGLDYKYGGTVFSYTNMRMTGLGQLKNTLQYRDEANGGMAYYINADGAKVSWQHNQAAPVESSDGRVYHDGLILPGSKVDDQGKFVENDIIISATQYYQTYVNDLASSFPPDRLFKNNYIKVREVSLSYTLPVKMANALKLQGLTLTAAARNLFYLYKTIPNIDVEAATGADGYVENTIYPGQQTFSLGLNVNF